MAAVSYSLQCHSTRIKTSKDPKQDKITTKYSVGVTVSPDSGSRSRSRVLSKRVATFNADQAFELYQYISELDYADTRPTGRKRAVKRMVSEEESDEDEEEKRSLAEKFTFNICYSNESSVRVHHSDICSGVAERLVTLQQLVELHLLGCPLTEESEYLIEFGPAYNLEVLKLEKLNLRRLHPSVGRLRNLNFLSLCYNRLTDLPLTIRLLKNLRHLHITGNPFNRLPGAVYHLHLDSIVGLNECPLKKDISSGWTEFKSNDIWWRRPLVTDEQRKDVESLQECCIRASVGMDCWQLEIPVRYAQRLLEMAETRGLCENCLKSVRKLTIKHESLGYTIHAQMAVFCGVRDVPFTFIACSQDCLHLTLAKLVRVNAARKAMDGFSKLPCCEYGLEFVQDLEEYRRLRAESLLPTTYHHAYGRNAPPSRTRAQSQSNTTYVSESTSTKCVLS